MATTSAATPSAAAPSDGTAPPTAAELKGKSLYLTDANRNGVFLRDFRWTLRGNSALTEFFAEPIDSTSNLFMIRCNTVNTNATEAYTKVNKEKNVFLAYGNKSGADLAKFEFRRTSLGLELFLNNTRPGCFDDYYDVSVGQWQLGRSFIPILVHFNVEDIWAPAAGALPSSKPTDSKASADAGSAATGTTGATGAAGAAGAAGGAGVAAGTLPSGPTGGATAGSVGGPTGATTGGAAGDASKDAPGAKPGATAGGASGGTTTINIYPPGYTGKATGGETDKPQVITHDGTTGAITVVYGPEHSAGAAGGSDQPKVTKQEGAAGGITVIYGPTCNHGSSTAGAGAEGAGAGAGAGAAGATQASMEEDLGITPGGMMDKPRFAQDSYGGQEPEVSTGGDKSAAPVTGGATPAGGAPPAKKEDDDDDLGITPGGMLDRRRDDD